MVNNKKMLGWCLFWGAFFTAAGVGWLFLSLGFGIRIVSIFVVLTFCGIMFAICMVAITTKKKKKHQYEMQRQAARGGYKYSNQSQSSDTTQSGKVCPECFSIVNQDEKSCKNCGTDLE